ncbi:LacI family DNA-binding transcriptional regulator [Microlunatus aurantiacus]|uniref:LacI family DNA-binding transcriptional regulator n=1 Tax=Microlunatus aurantiacus TaxID=446786 RepID=UPI0031D06D21
MVPPEPGEPSRPARIKDVAARAGVSLKTVTNVVHQRPYVKAETRARVQAAIDELDYRPSLAGRQLQSGRSNMITLAVPRIDEPYLGALAHRLIAAAAPRGYTVVMDETGGRVEREEQAARGYPGHGIDGVIYSPLALNPQLLAAMSRDTPMVLLGEPLPGSSADYVAIDNQGSAHEVVDHLVAQGRRRFVFLGGQPGLYPGVGEQRALAVDHRLAEHGLAPDDLVITTGRFRRGEGARRTRESLERLRDCDALVCASDLLALGAMFALREAGIGTPDDIAVVGWDNIDDGAYSQPTLTSVAPDLGALAEKAVDALITRIEGDRSESRSYVVPHELIIRRSSVRP